MDHPHPHHPRQQPKKLKKNAREKMRVKEQQRYQRKVEQNAEYSSSVMTETNVKVSKKEVVRNETHAHCKDLVKETVTSGLEREQVVVDNLSQSKMRSDRTVDEKSEHQISAVQEEEGSDLSPSMGLQSPGTEQAQAPFDGSSDEVVEKHYIFRLKKKNIRFPNAKFYCRLCNYHLDSVALCVKHWKEPRHSKLEETKSILEKIENIEAPTEAHAKALTALIESTVGKTALSDQDVKNRARIADKVEQVLCQTMKDIKVNLYGSSLSGFGFQDSDVNLNIEAPEGSIASHVLVMAYETLIAVGGYFEDVESDFEGRFPCIHFRDKQSGLRCELGTGSASAFKTSKLLLKYCQLDPRVHQLAMALRYWARLCGVDSQPDGSLPAYAFVLMTIYFLQQCTPPVVPVLQENETLEQHNCDSLGELWIKMLRYYTVDTAVEEIVISIRKREPVSREELKIPNRRLAIEDPIAVNKKNIAKSLSSNLVFQYLRDRLQDALLYFGKPQAAPCTRKIVQDPKTADPPGISQQRQHCTGSVVNDVTNSFDNESVDASVSASVETGTTSIHPSKQTVKLGKEGKNPTLDNVVTSNSENGSVPNSCTVSENSNDSKSVCSKDLTMLSSKLKTGSDSRLELSISKSVTGSDSDISVDSPLIDGSDKDGSTGDVDTPYGHSAETCVKDVGVQPKHLGQSAHRDDDSVLQQVEESSHLKASMDTTCCEADTRLQLAIPSPGISDGTGSCKSQDSLDLHAFNFVFDEKILTGGKKVMAVCNGCGKEGHKVSECPDDTLPKLVSLPPMDKGFQRRIDVLCRYVEGEYCLKEWEMKQRSDAIASYQRIIRQYGYPDATLYLFGSSKNGFGFTHSDMDICLKFQQHENAENLDIPAIVEDLAKKLKKYSKLRHVIAIPTAKVPIVKFVDPYMYLDVDISLYNCLAQANTNMLFVYSRIDPRVRQLVYMVKIFVKVCDIGDASKGSLSSYAYTLMMIFFLQQRKPPILPVLQELYVRSLNKAHMNTMYGDVQQTNIRDFAWIEHRSQLYQGRNKPEEMVEGWNAWYFKDLSKLNKIWPWRGTNKESAGELWLGFLRFFTEEFNNKKHVVSIKQHKPLTRFEKMWTSATRGFAIEDPFDLDHNLGSGVSRKMATFIMQVFIKAREHFGTPRNLASFKNDFGYFFDEYVLTGGEAPPNDRCCRVCGKIGHFLKDCPHRKGNKEGNKSKERDKETKRKDDDAERNKMKRDKAVNNARAIDVQQKDQNPNVAQNTMPKRVKEAAVHTGQAIEVNKDIIPGVNASVVTTQPGPNASSKTPAVQTTVYYSQGNGRPVTGDEKIGDTWKHHQEEKKYQKKEDTRRRARSDDENKMHPDKTPVSLASVSSPHALRTHHGQPTGSPLPKQLEPRNLNVQCQQVQPMNPQFVVASQPAILNRHTFRNVQIQQHQNLENARQQVAHKVQTSSPDQSNVITSDKFSMNMPGNLLHCDQKDLYQHQSEQLQLQAGQHQPGLHESTEASGPEHHSHRPKQQKEPLKQYHGQTSLNSNIASHNMEQQLNSAPVPIMLERLMNSSHCHRELPPNEKIFTLKDVEARQQSKQQLQPQHLPRPPSHTMSLHQHVPTHTSPPHPQFISSVCTPPSPAQMGMPGFPFSLSFPASPPRMSSPHQFRTPEAIWRMDTHATGYSNPRGSAWPTNTIQSQQLHGAGAPMSAVSGSSHENNIGSALLHGVSMLQNSESLNSYDVRDVPPLPGSAVVSPVQPTTPPVSYQHGHSQ